MKTRNELANDYHNRLPEGPFQKSFVHGAFVDGYDAGYQAAKEKYEAKIKEQADTLAGMEDECEGLKTIIYDKDETNLPTSANWISVKERLPEMDKWVLIDGPEVCKRIKPPSSNWKEQYAWETNHESFYSSNDVTHWMPLPKPSEEK